MFMVFLYHSEVFYGSGHSWSWLFEPIFLTGFFFVSGYLFTSDWSKVNLKTKWLQTVRAIIIPYFIFMAAFILPKVLLLHYEWKVSVSDIMLLRASWFVIATGVIQILFGITFQIRKSIKWVSFCSIIYTMIGLIFAMFLMRMDGWRNSSLLYSPAMPGCLPACINQAFLAVPFFTTGLFYRKYEDKIQIKPSYLFRWMLFFLYVALVIVNHKYIGGHINFASCVVEQPAMIFMLFAVAMTSFIAWAQKKDRLLPFNYIGKNSLLFYYFNVLMLRVAGKIYNTGILLLKNSIGEDFGGGYYDELIVTFLAVTFTFPIVWFINKHMPILNGNKTAFQKWTDRFGMKINW